MCAHRASTDLKVTLGIWPVNGGTILKHIMLQRENGTATAEESVFLGSNPEVTRNDDFNSVFQYGMV